MPARFGRECRDEKGYANRSRHRDENDQCSPGTGRGEEIGVIRDREPAQKCQIVDEADQITKHNCTEAGHDPNNQGKDGEMNEADSPNIFVSLFGRTGAGLPSVRGDVTPNDRAIGQWD